MQKILKHSTLSIEIKSEVSTAKLFEVRGLWCDVLFFHPDHRMNARREMFELQEQGLIFFN